VTPAPAADVAAELQAIRLAIHSLADAQADSVAGHQSHNLDEIHRSHPTTNWAACQTVMQLAMADAPERRWFDNDKSATLRGLLMMRPGQVLERFGAPSMTKIEQGQFTWEYRSPGELAGGAHEPWLEFVFDKGYVWRVVFNCP
jgi:hypothetical protein